jgi:hypothetical protein
MAVGQLRFVHLSTLVELGSFRELQYTRNLPPVPLCRNLKTRIFKYRRPGRYRTRMELTQRQ